VITGAGSGIGRALKALRCEGLVECSWRHHSGDRNERSVAE
jgi:NADP-dependent 3-hydroxy acid dehydrogenase YdfG